MSKKKKLTHAAYVVKADSQSSNKLRYVWYLGTGQSKRQTSPFTKQEGHISPLPVPIVSRSPRMTRYLPEDHSRRSTCFQSMELQQAEVTDKIDLGQLCDMLLVTSNQRIRQPAISPYLFIIRPQRHARSQFCHLALDCLVRSDTSLSLSLAILVKLQVTQPHAILATHGLQPNQKKKFARPSRKTKRQTFTLTQALFPTTYNKVTVSCLHKTATHPQTTEPPNTIESQLTSLAIP